eukprot:SAG11_NODE_44764_length_151_cov_98.096154_2_plen_34_part_01
MLWDTLYNNKMTTLKFNTQSSAGALPDFKSPLAT